MTANVLRLVILSVTLAVMPTQAASAEGAAASLASLKRAMAGHWHGNVSGTDESGKAFEAEDTFTFVVTSDNGLDSMSWSADTLEVATHESEGRYTVKNWNSSGRRGEVKLRARVTDEPDASGNGSWELELEQRASDGTVMEAREHFSLDGNSLRMSIEMRPAGSREAFETKVTGAWSRHSN